MVNGEEIATNGAHKKRPADHVIRRPKVKRDCLKDHSPLGRRVGLPSRAESRTTHVGSFA
jgi:hypothetical protein